MAKVLSMQVGQNVIRLAEVTTKGKKVLSIIDNNIDLEEKQ